LCRLTSPVTSLSPRPIGEATGQSILSLQPISKKAGQRSPAYDVLVWIVAITALIAVWSFLVVWYFVIFVVFGVFVIPYRLIRRSQRKALHVQKTALATQQAMFQQMSVQPQVPNQGTVVEVPPAPPSAMIDRQQGS
jgi:uncharacterized protein (DUF58 family)